MSPCTSGDTVLTSRIRDPGSNFTVDVPVTGELPAFPVNENVHSAFVTTFLPSLVAIEVVVDEMVPAVQVPLSAGE